MRRIASTWSQGEDGNLRRAVDSDWHIHSSDSATDEQRGASFLPESGNDRKFLSGDGPDPWQHYLSAVRVP